VKLGPIIDGLRVVTDGLTAGETIVVSGLQRVRPGSPVTPARVAMGERQRGDKPETLLARNAKLASNTIAPAAVGDSHAANSTATSSTSQATGARPTSGPGKAVIANASSGYDVWNGAPTTMVSATASHANKLALNPINDPARPTDAAVSN
jgi:hypothetical protein